MAAPGYITPDQLPKPVRVDSRDPGADTGQPNERASSEQFAQATNRPFARGNTTIAPLDARGRRHVPRRIRRKHQRGRREGQDAGHRHGRHRWHRARRRPRRARGSALALRVAARRVSDPSPLFRIDSVKIAGARPRPPPTLPSAIDIANLVLVPLGIWIALPRVHTDNGTTFVDPLRIGVVPSADRATRSSATSLGGATASARPCSSSCSTTPPATRNPAPAILVADIVTLSVTGGGSFNLNLGGTQAQTKNMLAVELAGRRAVGRRHGTFGSAPDAQALGRPRRRWTRTRPTNRFAGLRHAVERRGNASCAAGRRQSKDDDDHALLLAIVVSLLGALLIQGDLARMRRLDRVHGAR